ncbi:MAG: hypothetical protein IJ758_00430 [Clostridia bacterium]|nr:hypothetical protein [Clostridia bacterium]
MTFREFLEANPNEAKRASSCKNIQEFKKLADEHGITYADEAELQSAYSFIKGEDIELNEDMLEAVSGGSKGDITITSNTTIDEHGQTKKTDTTTKTDRHGNKTVTEDITYYFN